MGLKGREQMQALDGTLYQMTRVQAWTSCKVEQAQLRQASKGNQQKPLTCATTMLAFLEKLSCTKHAWSAAQLAIWAEP